VYKAKPCGVADLTDLANFFARWANIGQTGTIFAAAFSVQHEKIGQTF